MALERPDVSLQSVRQRLQEVKHPSEERSPLDPRLLAGGSWRGDDPLQGWPPRLLAGVLEARQGYRFRPENLALTTLLEGATATRVLDLGAGSGSLLLLAALWTGATAALGLERQPAVAERLERTLAAHDLPGVTALCGDLRDAATRDAALQRLGGPADLIITNPPFYPPDWGRPSAQPETHASTHALHGDIVDFLTAARDLLAPQGRVFVVFDATRLHHLLPAISAAGLGLHQLSWIADQRPDHHHLATRCWLELRADAPTVLPLAFNRGSGGGSPPAAGGDPPTT